MLGVGTALIRWQQVATDPKAPFEFSGIPRYASDPSYMGISEYGHN